MGLPDIVGLLGAVFYLSAYALIQLRIYTVDDAIITVLNILGGIALIYSLSWNFNLFHHHANCVACLYRCWLCAFSRDGPPPRRDGTRRISLIIFM